MKTKLFLIVILIVSLLFGCKNEGEQKKEKYDSAINQVIILENKRLQKEKILRDNEILNREETGIIVYSNGKYIELLYTIKNKQMESIYQEKDNNYEQFPQNSTELKKIDKYLQDASYTENVGLK